MPPPPRPRGITLCAVLTVLAIVAIAAVGAQIYRQRRGTQWLGLGFSPEELAPRCLMPGDTALVEGTADAYAGARKCYSLRVAGEPAEDMTRALAQGAGAACGPPGTPLLYVGSGTYRCAIEPSGFCGRRRCPEHAYARNWAWASGADRENFSPDAPGACSGTGGAAAWKINDRAAFDEQEALRVLDGLV